MKGTFEDCREDLDALYNEELIRTKRKLDNLKEEIKKLKEELLFYKKLDNNDEADY